MVGILLRLIGRGVRDMGLHPWAQVLTLAAVTLVTFLAGLLLLLFVNLNQELQVTRGELVFQVFWKPDAPMELVKSRWDEMQHLPWLESLKTFTPDEALGALTKSRAGAAQWLGEKNPLPPTAVLRFAPRDADTRAWYAETRKYLESMPGVESIRDNPLNDEFGAAWKAFTNTFMWPSIGFLALVLSLVVGNTIKLSLLHRKDEIEILQLVGAKGWYIRLPLLVTGAIQGVLGGASAVGLLWVAWYHIQDVLNFPPLHLTLAFLLPEQAGLLIAVPCLMGIVSSWLAVRD